MSLWGDDFEALSRAHASGTISSATLLKKLGGALLINGYREIGFTARLRNMQKLFEKPTCPTCDKPASHEIQAVPLLIDVEDRGDGVFEHGEDGAEIQWSDAKPFPELVGAYVCSDNPGGANTALLYCSSCGCEWESLYDEHTRGKD